MKYLSRFMFLISHHSENNILAIQLEESNEIIQLALNIWLL